MPDSYGKRQRDQVKARKAAAKDERRRRNRGGPEPAPTFGEGIGWADPAAPAGDPEPAPDAEPSKPPEAPSEPEG